MSRNGSRGTPFAPHGPSETRAMLDYEALDLRTFFTGALIRYDGRFHRLADPIREPRHALAALTAPVATLGDRLRVARLRAHVQHMAVDELLEQPEIKTIEALRDRWGFSERIVERFFRPFLGGIFLEPDLMTTSRMFEFVFKMFSEGSAALPSAGMEAIPRQLATALPEGSISLGARVASLEPRAVTLESGDRLEAGAIVLATEAPEAARLLDTPPPRRYRPGRCRHKARRR